jgi:hypothetical protein
MITSVTPQPVREAPRPRLQQIRNVRIQTVSGKVFLVPKHWFNHLVAWISELRAAPPPLIDNSDLLSLGTPDVVKAPGIDFEVVDEPIWRILEGAFRCPHPIFRPIAVHPITCRPTVVIHRITLHIFTPKGVYQKTLAAEWSIGDLREPLSARLSLRGEPIFLNWQTNLAVDEAMTVGEYSAKFGVRIKFETCQVQPRRRLPMSSLVSTMTFSDVRVDDTLLSDAHLPQRKSGTVVEIRMPRLVGLINSGNGCYFNSILQCLCRISLLNNFVLSPSFSMFVNEANARGGLIAKEYRKFLEAMAQSGNFPQDPRALQRAVARSYHQFANTEQHDAQEMLGALLDGLHEDLARHENGVPSRPRSSAIYSTDRCSRDSYARAAALSRRSSSRSSSCPCRSQRRPQALLTFAIASTTS